MFETYEVRLAENGFPAREVSPGEWDPRESTYHGDTLLRVDLPAGFPGGKWVGAKFSGADVRSREAACRRIWKKLAAEGLVKEGGDV